MFNKGQMAGLMKQAQAMQDKLKAAQDEIANAEVTGQAASGAIKILMTGKHYTKRVEIDAALIADSVQDKEMLEDLLVAAFNDGVRQIEALTESKMGKISAALPGGMKLPF